MIGLNDKQVSQTTALMKKEFIYLYKLITKTWLQMIRTFINIIINLNVVTNKTSQVCHWFSTLSTYFRFEELIGDVTDIPS